MATNRGHQLRRGRLGPNLVAWVVGTIQRRFHNLHLFINSFWEPQGDLVMAVYYMLVNFRGCR